MLITQLSQLQSWSWFSRLLSETLLTVFKGLYLLSIFMSLYLSISQSSYSVGCHFRALVLFLVSGRHVRLLRVSFILTDGSGTAQPSTITAVAAVLEHRWFEMPRMSSTWVRNSLIQHHLLITRCMSGTWFEEPRRTDSQNHCSYSGREATVTAGCGG